LPDPLRHFDADRAQLFRQPRTGLVFLERQLRVRMEMTIQLDQLRLMSLGPGCRVFPAAARSREEHESNHGGGRQNLRKSHTDGFQKFLALGIAIAKKRALILSRLSL